MRICVKGTVERHILKESILAGLIKSWMTFFIKNMFNQMLTTNIDVDSVVSILVQEKIFLSFKSKLKRKKSWIYHISFTVKQGRESARVRPGL